MSKGIVGKGAVAVRQIAIELRAENEVLRKKVLALEAKNKDIQDKSSKVKTKIKIKTKTENLPEFRKVLIGKTYARQYIAKKIKADFNTKISDLSKVTLITADFCSQFKLSPRQLGILLYAANFKQVRKNDLYEGRDVGNWYAQTLDALFEKNLVMRTNTEMIKWIYFTLTPSGERLVRAYNERIKTYIHE